jgi:regulatory protein
MFRRSWKKKDPVEDGEPREIADPVRARERTMNRAVKLLAAKPRSVEELRTRLLERSWTNEEIVASVIETLSEYKYLDDKQYAADLAASKLRQKPIGKRRLQQSMSMKQLDSEIVSEAIDAAYEKMPEAGLIDRAIEKRLRLKGAPETREDTKKFYDYLMRQGFDYGLIRDKMSRIGKREFNRDEGDTGDETF